MAERTSVEQLLEAANAAVLFPDRRPSKRGYVGDRLADCFEHVNTSRRSAFALLTALPPPFARSDTHYVPSGYRP